MHIFRFMNIHYINTFRFINIHFNIVITVSHSTLDDHKNKWSRHRSFLYGCDRLPEMHVLKLGIKIPNQERYNWSTK